MSVESATVLTVVALTAGCVLEGLDGCEVRLCDPCALVRLRVPCVSRVCTGSPRCLFTGPGGAGGGWVGFAGGGLGVGRGERSAPGLRPLSRPLIRSSRGRLGALVGWDACEVRLCDSCVRVCPGSPGVFLPARIGPVVRFAFGARRPRNCSGEHTTRH